MFESRFWFKFFLLRSYKILSYQDKIEYKHARTQFVRFSSEKIVHLIFYSFEKSVETLNMLTNISLLKWYMTILKYPTAESHWLYFLINISSPSPYIFLRPISKFQQKIYSWHLINFDVAALWTVLKISKGYSITRTNLESQLISYLYRKSGSIFSKWFEFWKK